MPKSPPVCPTHGTPLTCHRCNAAKGGKSRSAKKLAAVTETLAHVNAVSKATKTRRARKAVKARWAKAKDAGAITRHIRESPFGDGE